ncbi:MAG TPA: hypothetical protein VLC71_01015 [Thermomonas sp.]|nr:hypothetical protein [Thermomonas sp.]
MTRAVRSALAVSALALALGASGGALAAGHKAPQAQVLKVERAAIDFAPVHDLTIAPSVITETVPPELFPTLIDESEIGDVVIDNADPIEEADFKYSVTAISGYSSEGNVEITNHEGADLYVASVPGSAIGIYGYALVGDVSIDNAADIEAFSGLYLADGIFASGANVDVANSGDIVAEGYGWAAGIEAQATGDLYVGNTGDITASIYDVGSAFGIYATGADVTVVNEGDIDAQGYSATGIEAQSTGDLSITNGGDIVGGVLTSVYDYYSGYTYLYGSLVGAGINATSNGEGAVVSVTSSGDISSQGYYGATGIAATSGGLGGSASVTNSGSIYASQYNKYGYGAYGIVVSADGDASIDNSGEITVDSAGIANGAVALSFAGDASVTNSGDITVTTDAFLYYGANGIVAFAGNGSAYAGNSGTVDVTSKYISSGIDVSGLEDATASNSGDISVDAWRAYGIRAQAGNGDVDVANEGTIYATYSPGGGTAFGILGLSGNGDVSVDNDGDITTTVGGQSVGIFGLAYSGDVTVSTSGTIDAYSYSNAALGVFARADYGTATVDNSGAISAYSYYGVAYGVLARGEYSSVSNSGDIEASAYYAAAGIIATSYYGTTVTTTGGSISAIAVGEGLGIDARSFYGDVSVDNASDIEAVGIVLGARGINAAAYSGGLVDVDNSGDIYAGSLYGDSIGIYGYSVGGDVSIDNSGDITAISYYGLADGIFASGANVDVTNSGAIEVYGYTWAAGIEAQGDDSATVDNSGDISVIAPGFLQVQDYYGVIGYAPGVQAFGIYATGGAGGVELANSGDISVDGGYTTGIEVQSSGDIHITNGGDIASGSGYNTFYNEANYYTYFYGTQVATGINATSNGEGAHVDVTNSGDISADGIFGASGIAATSGGLGGSASVDNSGDIYVSQNQKYGYGAYGIVVSADGDGAITNSGAIEVYSGGIANGATALSFAGDASVTNSGDINVENSALLYYNATGIVAFAGNGDAMVDNGGGITAVSSYWATGIDVRGFGDATVENSGSVLADGQKYAFGVYATAGSGDVDVANTDHGDIYAYSYIGRAWGVFGYSAQGDVNVVNDGAIGTYAYGQSAGIFGRSGHGDVHVANTGSIEAITGGNVAVGVFARADYGTASVSNGGDIVASVEGVNGYIGDYAYGILANGEYAQVGNFGSIYAFGIYSATGIAARSFYGTTVTTAATSDIEAYSLLVTIGIEGRSEYGNVSITNFGDISVEGVLGGGVGIQAYSGLQGSVVVTNGGDIAASSEYGTAIGITGYSVGGNTAVTNGGTVEASGYYGAYGIAAQSYLGSVNVTNASAGHVHASAPSYAYGIFANAYGNVTINNAGAVSASADAGGHAAAVLMESLHGSSTLHNAATGVISVSGSDGDAFAVIGSDAVDTINNNGRITGALALYGGNDVFNNRSGGVWSTGGTHSTDFGDGNDTLDNLAGGVVDILTGAISFGAGNDTLANAGTVRIGTGGTISFGDGNDTLTNATTGLIDVVGGTIATDAGNDTITNFGTFRLTGGTVTMGAGTNAFTNIGILKALGNSAVDVGAAGTLTNVNSIDLVDDAANDSLTVTGTLAGTGALNIDVNLSTSTADQLVVTGNVAASAVQTVNVLFPGLPTTAHTSAVFARVSGTSAASNFVAGQIFGYSPANFLDLDLTVSSQINTANTAPDLHSINVDVVGLSDSGSLAAVVASGAAGFLNSQVGTFRQRLGVNPYGDAGKVLSAFFRAYTDEGDVNVDAVAANFGQGGNFDYDQSSWGREVGVNANLFGNLHAGVVLGTADSRQRLTGAGVGENRLDGTTWGAYATWYVPQGFYVDLTGRWMAMDVTSRSIAGVLQTRAHTSATSIEAGYEWAVGGFNIVPQVQFTHTSVDDVRTVSFDRASFESHGGNSERGRLGVEVNKTFNAGNLLWTPYGSLSAIHEFEGDMDYTVADNFFGSTSVDGTSVMAELGVGLQSGGWGFTIGANWTDGGALDGGVSGQANIRFAW